ncbi:flagellar biosynthesis protein FlhB [Ectothiorhodospira lacustris]|uniref:flagellar biosynthesis protein FlhB n=1 Tax=Ectothiorhodospira lacustris TaxID=2899127 RepID=UPI001EE8EFE7|nr:flagellar biosynthesis protein FlhB [Ectothiorhodospira lacustris]MCG5511095.1 flagellar type III secretion system protein FlhB [Ectothiorhodospira lacustris]MCG5522897.1 flagellar type III secretion system protein FlhB [Ectothiorhodospira lacustris]
MAENESSQEKTEQPTPKRLRDAQDKGQVASSKELNTTLVLLTGSTTLLLFGGVFLNHIQALMRNSLIIDRDRIFDPSFMLTALHARIGEGLMILAPLFLVLVIAAVTGPVVMGGGRFRLKGLEPKPDKLSPIKGLKRIFGPQGLMELAKTLAKFSLISVVAMGILWQFSDRLLGLGGQEMVPGVVSAGYMIAWTFVALSVSLILVVMIDVPFQLWNHQRQLRMTKQEIKDEFKETEGKPEVKSRVRQLQYEVSRRRMMAEVPKADVVVTNPTHFAVALKYDQQKGGAPRVVAKGADLVAGEIREVARQSGVTILSAPPLARALFHSTRLEQEIPAGLYVAVAQVLAYVYQLRNALREGGVVPTPPTDLPVPDEFLKRDVPPAENA